MKAKIPPSLSLILPTVNEKMFIRIAVRAFEQAGIDEIIVVDNNASYDTGERLKGTKARVVREKVQGYGAAIRAGLREARGEYIAICEPDGTFIPEDIRKLNSYAGDFDYILGTRTSSVMIWKGANMGFFLRWGNYFAAKFVEFIFNTSSLTDAGCTFRLIKRSALRKIERQFTCLGSDFGLEMTILVIKKKIKFIEIPLNYRKRVGNSTITGDIKKAIVLGLRMMLLALQYRLGFK